MSIAQALTAILFVAEQPVPTEELAEVLESSVETIGQELESLRRRLDEAELGLTVRNVGGGWRLYTVPDAQPYLERFSATSTAARLSNAALEVLAIVAYQQPVSRGQIAEIRGVDSASAINTLVRRGLIEERARLPLPGNPAVYGTTVMFLEKLGIDSLGELPPLADHVPPPGIVDTLERTLQIDL